MSARKPIFAFLISASLLSGCFSADIGSSGDRESSAVEKTGLEPGDHEAWEEIFENNDIDNDFRKSLFEFSLESASTILAQEEGNVVFSPLSLYYALAILGEGASGETEEEILSALHSEDKNKLSDQCARLSGRYAYNKEYDRLWAKEYGEAEPEGSIDLANSLWISDGIALDPEFQEICADDFYASSYMVDFTAEKNKEQISGWISDNTKGILSPAIDLSPDTVLAIVNTLYFYGGWQEKFDESMTKEDIFRPLDGTEINKTIKM